MKTLTKNAFYAFAAAALLTSCSRPYATFQRTQPERFAQTAKTEVAPVAVAQPAAAAEAPVVAAQPAEAVAQTTPVTPAAVTPAQPVATVADAQQALAQAEASIKAKPELANNKRIANRMAEVKNLLATASARPAEGSAAVTSAKKMSFAEKMAVKSVDKKIQKKLSPKEAKARSFFTIGLVVGIIGLLLILLGNGFGVTIGVIALVVGLILILLDLIQ